MINRIAMLLAVAVGAMAAAQNVYVWQQQQPRNNLKGDTKLIHCEISWLANLRYI
jgi:hypothetical protein